MAQKKKKVSLITKIFVTAFAVYAAFTLVSLQFQIEKKQTEQDRLQQELDARQLTNSELSDAIGGEIDAEYIAKLARADLGYIFPGEQIFKDVSSK